MDRRINNAFKWLDSCHPNSVKELSRLITAYALWDIPDHYADWLIRMKIDSNWNGSIRDTARACSALAGIGMVFPSSVDWLLDRQHDGAWNDDVYDTAYVLTALASMDELNEDGCKWLVENYGPDWEHVGTTSLVITALIKQETLVGTDKYRDFINQRAQWVLSQRGQKGDWKFISTSNIVIQALMLAGFKDELVISIVWLLGKSNDNGSWGKDKGDIIATSMSLITLGLYRAQSRRLC
ncbi:MAG: terpene cyclase/mutase family protein [Methanosarcinaceae archaeon]|nr:terpene cyclase/mutase family protein [Methanosarcinaceae archaeon]